MIFLGKKCFLVFLFFRFCHVSLRGPVNNYTLRTHQNKAVGRRGYLWCDLDRCQPEIISHIAFYETLSQKRNNTLKVKRQAKQRRMFNRKVGRKRERDKTYFNYMALQLLRAKYQLRDFDKQYVSSHSSEYNEVKRHIKRVIFEMFRDTKLCLNISFYE